MAGCRSCSRWRRAPGIGSGPWTSPAASSWPGAVVQPVLRVEPGQPFVAARMNADADAVRALYRQQGFRAAEVTASAEPAGGDPTQLVVKLAITEGPRTLVGDVVFEHVSAIPVATLQAAVRSRTGRSLLPAAHRRRSRSRRIPVPAAGLPAGDRHDPDGVQRRRHPLHLEIRRERGAAEPHRPRPDRRKRADEGRDDRTRGRPRARHAALVRRAGGRSAAAERAGPVPEDPGVAGDAGPGQPSRRPGHRGGGPGLLDRVRRRPRRRLRPEDQCRDRPARGTVRRRAARVLRDRASKPVGQEPLAEPVRPRRPPHERDVQHRPGAARLDHGGVDRRHQRVPHPRRVPRAVVHGPAVRLHRHRRTWTRRSGRRSTSTGSRCSRRAATASARRWPWPGATR